MANDEYERALKEAERELDDLLQKRDAMDARVLRLNSTVNSLRALCEKEPRFFPVELKGLGITDAVRQVLRYANRYMSATEIRDALVQAGFDLSNQSNPMASIHSVLGRLGLSEQLFCTNENGEQKYMWVTPLRRALLEENENRGIFLDSAFGEKFGRGSKK